ncbi:glycosyltransferase [Paraflavitalea speifideaquila]|uniref:glycosyltransferase n=1 Tax=Paraflavitalea speifideaquila TaxID=3076558 RepID=UPI0028E224ED|nr:glycosyltransferase [Paraflavitalea speifideiaquila]
MTFYRISFCTVCMNRTQHLKETLLRNIQDNIDYPQLEFVLLNYGSKDDMHEWVIGQMGEYLESGILKYYKADFPEVFKMSHSKNMAFKLATGDILCGLDADNYTGPGFAHYINKLFVKDNNIFLAPPWIGPGKKWWDVQGRLCLWKKTFMHSADTMKVSRIMGMMTRTSNTG